MREQFLSEKWLASHPYFFSLEFKYVNWKVRTNKAYTQATRLLQPLKLREGFNHQLPIPKFVATPNSIAVPTKPISVSAMQEWCHICSNILYVSSVCSSCNLYVCYESNFDSVYVGVPGPNEVHNSSYSNDSRMWPTGETMTEK